MASYFDLSSGDDDESGLSHFVSYGWLSSRFLRSGCGIEIRYQTILSMCGWSGRILDERNSDVDCLSSSALELLERSQCDVASRTS